MNKTKKMLRLYLLACVNNVRSLLAYKLDFVVGVAAMLLNNGMQFLTLFFIFSLVDSVKGWTIMQMVFLYGLATIVIGLWHCFFINIITIPYYIRSGEFDRFLLRPTNLLFQIAMEELDTDGWGELLLGMIITAIAYAKLHLPLWKLPLLIPFACSGCLILISISLLFSTIAFVSLGGSAMSDVMMELFDFARYPLNIFNHGLRFVLSVILPIGFVTFYPGMVFMTGNAWRYAVLIPLGSLAYFAIAYRIWYHATKSYVSAGN